MNAKIKLLADQCTENVDDGGYGYDVFDKEKVRCFQSEAEHQLSFLQSPENWKQIRNEVYSSTARSTQA